MGTTQDHRKYAEECVAMARLSEAESDKALWLTLAQSWVRLAEHVARVESRATVVATSDETVG
jgi:pyridoxine/pyridoxamine 5'-phosphate oxidase